jgi:uncharacterized membrane protein YfcA
MTSQHFALLLSLLIGVSLGALGGGGSIITLPVLVYVAGIAPKAAIGMSMAIVGGTSLLGSYLHSRKGNFALRTAIYFCLAGMVGAYLGSMGTHLVSSKLLLLLFAGLMFVVGTLMFLGRQPKVHPGAAHSPAICLPTGFLVGVMTGFLGVGGGFLIVPALVWLTGLDTKKAVGTSLAIIAFNSASGLAGQARYAHWDWALTAQFVVAALAGMGLGVSIATRSPDRSLRKGFAVMVLVVAAAMTWRVLRP